MPATDETPPKSSKFDFSAFPPDTLFYDRRSGLERRDRPEAPAPAPVEPPEAVAPAAPRERRARKERRKRIDPTTFEKQYTDDEIEFMNAVQQYKTRTGKSFPSHGDVLRIALNLGYRKTFWVEDEDSTIEEEPSRETAPCGPI
jgi:hypothetical protein